MKRHIRQSAQPRIPGMRGVLYLCLILLSLTALLPSSRAANPGASSAAAPGEAVDNTLQAYLITAWPGSEIYELCGHEAIRITGNGLDSIWNFGEFDFNEPNFVYRFVKGETDYMVMGYPFKYFMPPYVAQGRRVEEQTLNLTPQEVARLRKILQRNSLPPLNRYRYNYIKNNCSTQIADILDSVAGGKVEYHDTVKYETYRDAMRGYHVNYPWYQTGIDVALGSGLEEKLTAREELFIPTEFYRHAKNATLPDGRPLVKSNTVLNEGTPEAVLPPTPFLLTPLWLSIVVAAISAIVIIAGIRRRSVQKWWYALYFACVGIAGIVVSFLVFISSHAATSPNLLIFWLNPLQLIIPFFIWWRKMRPVVNAMMWLNIAAVGLLIVLTPIFNRGQGGNAALIIMMAADVALAAGYLYINSEKFSAGKGGRKRASGVPARKPQTRKQRKR